MRAPWSGGCVGGWTWRPAWSAGPGCCTWTSRPTGLDPRSRQAVWQVVAGLASSGVTIVLTTQYLEEADRLADRIAVLDGGRAVAWCLGIPVASVAVSGVLFRRRTA
jgi:ABC-2 type transport system ATP-binding protein